MSYNRIAILARLRTTLINNTHPDHAFAELAGRLTVDPKFRTMLYTIADGRPLPAALMWTRIADHLTGQPRVEALGLAAVFSFRGGNPGLAATLIERADVAARRDHTEFPAILEVLKLDHRVREHLSHVAA
jgi:hypothetical protein